MPKLVSGSVPTLKVRLLRHFVCPSLALSLPGWRLGALPRVGAPMIGTVVPVCVDSEYPHDRLS